MLLGFSLKFQVGPLATVSEEAFPSVAPKILVDLTIFLPYIAKNIHFQQGYCGRKKVVFSW